MKRTLLVLLLLTACATPPPVDPQVGGAIKALTDALAQQPTNMPWIYVLATYHDQARNDREVVRWLRRLDELGWTHGIAAYDFKNTRSRAFRDLVARLNEREPQVSRAEVAFTIAGQSDIMPEGIAYDAKDDVFYVSSITRRKVLRVDRGGRATDFVAEGQDGMLGALGMKVDPERRLLWVAAADEKDGRAALFAYGLEDGKLVRKIAQGTKEEPSFLNDLALLRDGTVLATDTTRLSVLRLAPGADAFEVLASDFRYPNGIAVSPDERFAWVADFRGITLVYLADKSKQKIETAELLNGIDGLTYHRNTLIGIQNAIGRPRVVRLHLADSRVEILESRNPHFELPTTGTIARGEYFFIANPGLRGKVGDPVMLKIAL